MAIIGNALRQAFMPKHEYESLREEDKIWTRLQKPILIGSIGTICIAVFVCTIISLKIVFPEDALKRPFCDDWRLQPLPLNAKGGGTGDSDPFPGAFSLTDQETIDYYWMVVFIPSAVIFLASVAYLVAVNMQLPNQWLWDMVDEFVYQFQSFCQYRAKMKNKTEQEIALLRQFDQAWNVYGVLNYLQAFVEKSNIIQILEQEKEGIEQFTATDGYDYSGGSNVLKVLGYFSMVGLLRVHCLLGDYQTGLKCLLPIDINQQGVYTSVIGSHITTIYHYGFASLMMRRYVKAIREFNKMLLYIYKTKQYHQKSPQYEQILKKNEQMYALLAICLSLCPQTKLVEETVNSQLREKYGEKMARMQRYDDEAFAIYDELFSYACPKFITPSAPSFEEPLVNYNQDAYRLQLKLFLYEVKQQQLLSGVRTFLKVYSTISLGKLANYMEVDEPTLRTILFSYKHKTHAVDSDGKIISNADVDFYIDDDMIHVVESKPVKRFGDYFLRQIVKLEGVINDMDRIRLE
ncbi:hypothetical protein GOBAR_AA39939 [Gossypium barbadense]|uniref:Eukaryotic translation initiation factor 3 subunit L n=1 Tax=Gossypium barbadense TaxID=3634 RepID=A0A2P5VPJ5_GOSBA|nr:hypothetical protein GOBAR_AA39939 [Gossypium barbadense]